LLFSAYLALLSRWLLNLGEGDTDEGALLPERMGKGESRGGEDELVAGIVKGLDEVDVDGAVGVDTVDRFFSAPEGAFDGLGSREDGERGEGRLDSATEVAERMCRFEAPGFGIKE